MQGLTACTTHSPVHVLSPRNLVYSYDLKSKIFDAIKDNHKFLRKIHLQVGHPSLLSCCLVNIKFRDAELNKLGDSRSGIHVEHRG